MVEFFVVEIFIILIGFSLVGVCMFNLVCKVNRVFLEIDYDIDILISKVFYLENEISNIRRENDLILDKYKNDIDYLLDELYSDKSDKEEVENRNNF